MYLLVLSKYIAFNVYWLWKIDTPRFSKTKSPHREFPFDKEERRKGFAMLFKENRRGLNEVRDDVERVKGIEPSYSAWEADVLPLNYTRMVALVFYHQRKIYASAFLVPHQLYFNSPAAFSSIVL